MSVIAPRPIVSTKANRQEGRWSWLPQTKQGQVKTRLSRHDKLKMLSPRAPSKRTLAWLKSFQQLFYFSRFAPILRRAGGNWATLSRPLTLDEIARHLLGDRVPTLNPIWVGSRGGKSIRFVAIDVDNHPPPPDLSDAIKHAHNEVAQRNLIEKQRKLQKRLAIPPFTVRCQQVEAALQLLGIDPSNPNEVLIQATPSGGRHYYFFLDASYSPGQIPDLLQAAGLREADGQIEFYPKANRGLRLPFGHVPNERFRPWAWIKFIKAYRNRTIRRFSFQELYDNLDRNTLRRQSPAPEQPGSPPAPLTQSPTPQRPLPRGVPKARQARPYPTLPSPCASSPPYDPPATAAASRYLAILEQGIKSNRDADELLALGIAVPGTRTQALKRLATHLMWFRGLTAEAAAEFLTRWAMDPRHKSKDIQADLANGTQHVAAHINRICQWWAKKQRSQTEIADTRPSGPLFSPAELNTLRAFVLPLPKEDRLPQAHFLLSFLWFAKQHGRPTPDHQGWKAAPAITAVVKKWPGCRHGNDYTLRFTRANGLIGVITPHRHNPHGKGLARTYRIAVTVEPKEKWVIDYNNALQILTAEAAIVEPRTTACPTAREQAHERQDTNIPSRKTDPVSNYAALARACAEKALAFQRQSPPETGANPGLPDQAPETHRAVPAPATTNRRQEIDACDPLRLSYLATSRGYGRVRDRGTREVFTLVTPPPCDDLEGINTVIQVNRYNINQDPRGKSLKHQIPWGLVTEMAQDPRYSPEDRYLLLSDPVDLSDPDRRRMLTLIKSFRQKRSSQVPPMSQGCNRPP
jgi:hypothetical protein